MGRDADAAPRRESAFAHYLRDTRDLSTGFLFALPLLLAYELGVVMTGTPVVNGASALIQFLIQLIAPKGWALAVFNGLVVLAVFAAVIRTNERGKHVVRPWTYLAMFVESLLYATVLLMLLGWIGNAASGAICADAQAAARRPVRLGDDPVLGVVLSLGAGVYEEIFFRFMLLGGFAWLLRSGFGVEKPNAESTALVVSAIIFALFHHIGPYGDPIAPLILLVRTVAGVFLGSIFLRRGLGIAIWSHALYDVFVVVLQNLAHGPG